VQPGSVVDLTGVVDIRMNWGNYPNPTILNWNPGAGAGDQFVERITMGNNQTSGGSTFNHFSGSIRLDADWFHVGRRGDATYISSGFAKLVADDRISLAEGANNHATDAYVEMWNFAQMRTRRGATSLDVADAQGNSGNESFIGGAGGNATTARLIMNDNSMVESQHWRLSRNAGGASTVTLNDAAQFRNRNNGQISVGHNGTSTMVANDFSQIMLLGGGGGSLRVGDNNNAVGDLTLNQNAKVIGINGTSHHVVIGDDGTGKGTVTMNDNSGFERVRNVWVGNGGSSEGTLIMRNNSYVDNTAGGGDAFRIAQGGTSTGTLLMFDQANITTRNFGIDQEGGGGGQATVVQNESSTVKVTGGWMEIGGGNSDTSTYTMNNDSRLDAQGWLVVGQRANGRGEMYINDNASVESNAIGGNLMVGNRDNSDGYLEINGSGSILARAALRVGHDAGSKGDVQQNAGTVQVNGNLRVGRNGGTALGTYNLDGGTLRVNDIRLQDGGTFNWGAGTLTMTEINAGNDISVTGDLTTGTAGSPNAVATLDLGDLYKSAGTKYDVMTVSGALNLTSNADVLDFWNDMQHLRSGGGAGVELQGEIKLVGAASVSGQFDTIVGPGGDGVFFRTWTPAEATTLGITGSGDLTRNRGAVIYRADGVYFVYNVSGQIPEPATGLFLFFGAALLRGISLFRTRFHFSKRFEAIG